MKKILIALIFIATSFITAFSQGKMTDKILYENASGTQAGAVTVQQLKDSIANGLSSGTVTSVGVSVPTGLSVSGSPITSSGTIAISNNLAAGYVSSSGVGGSLTSSSTIPGSAISGNITGNAGGLTSTLAVGSGGTGATTLTGYVKGNGTSAMTASSTIPTSDLSGTITNAQLANNSITINGTATALGGTRTIDLASVTAQGATTATATTYSGGLTASGGLTSSGATTISGGLNYGVGAQITANATLATSDVLREINATSTVTVTVPASLSTGRVIELPLAQTSTGSVVVNSGGSETFNGSSTFTVAANSQGTTIILRKVSSTNYKVTLSW